MRCRYYLRRSPFRLLHSLQERWRRRLRDRLLKARADRKLRSGKRLDGRWQAEILRPRVGGLGRRADTAEDAEGGFVRTALRPADRRHPWRAVWRLRIRSEF